MPFFDTQPVATHPSSPLRGAGIFYKGKTGYGGFVAPLITTYDFSKEMHVRIPKKEERKEEEENELPVIA